MFNSPFTAGKALADAAAKEEARAAGLDGPLGGLKMLPEGVMEQRRQLNPRDRPNQENDPDYG